MTTPPGLLCFLQPLGRLPGDERRALHHLFDEVVVPRDRAFGKHDERPLAGDEDVDRRVDRLPIVAFAKHAERAHAAHHERLEPALLEHVPTGHREQVAIGLHAEDAEHHRIGHAGNDSARA